MLSNYPPGLSDWTPDAPWNQEDPPERDFDITCSQTLSKSVVITTNNYIPGASGVDYDSDDEGGYYATSWNDPDDTSDTNWSEEYDDSNHYTPLELINLFKQFLEENLNNGLVFKNPSFTKSLIGECEGWQDDETEFVEG